MKKIALHIINGKGRMGFMRNLLLLSLCCIAGVNLIGCAYKNRGDYLAKTAREEDGQSDAIMQSIIDALEAQDREALKDLFSPYALENTEEIDKKIEELMNFYPGSEGGFEGDNISKRGANYGDITLILLGSYTVINGNQEYQIRFVTFPQNDKEPDKTGLYLIEIMTEEAEPEGFKWKNEEDAPGVYVLE